MGVSHSAQCISSSQLNTAVSLAEVAKQCYCLLSEPNIGFSKRVWNNDGIQQGRSMGSTNGSWEYCTQDQKPYQVSLGFMEGII